MRIIKAKIISVTDGNYQKIVNAIGRPNEEIVNRSYFQHFGFTSRPPSGAVGIFIEDRNNLTMIASEVKAILPEGGENPERPEMLNEGDAALYSSVDTYVKVSKEDEDIRITNGNKNQIRLKSTGEVEIWNSDARLKVLANGDIELGNTPLKSLMTEDIIAKFNTHTHNESGSVTDVPNQLWSSSDATQNTKAK